MCNYLNNYDNLNGWSLHSVYIFNLKNVPKKKKYYFPYLSGKGVGPLSGVFGPYLKTYNL